MATSDRHAGSGTDGVTLVIGGARSGKSRHAEGLTLATGLSPIYVATARAFDDEMRARILEHQRRRDSRWRQIETPLDLVETIEDAARGDTAILVECLTLWLTNLMLAERDVAAEAARLVACLRRAQGAIVLVSNEVGQGVVPTNAMARAFVDHAGRLHQDIAAIADRVVLMTAGLPLTLK